MNAFNRNVAALVCLAVLNLSSPLVAQAAVIGTLQAVQSGQRDADLAVVNAALDREQVRAQFESMGADPAEVGARLGALTNAELHALAGEVERLPAGGDALAIVGIVFLVLLILEAVGVIDIFKKFP